MNYSLRKIGISDNLAIIEPLMDALHQSEISMNPRTKNWQDFRENYIQYMLEVEAENDAAFIIAEKDGETIGFIFGYVETLENSEFEQGEGVDLYVSEGYVKEEFRKLGIYTALNNFLEENYKDFPIRKTYRYTLVKNLTMQKWLDKQGYQPVRIVYEKWKQ